MWGNYSRNKRGEFTGMKGIGRNGKEIEHGSFEVY
jgi:hypothetical protein